MRRSKCSFCPTWVQPNTHTTINTRIGQQKQQMAKGLLPLYPRPTVPRQTAEALLVSLSFQHGIPVCLPSWSVLFYCPYLWSLVAYKLLLVITFTNPHQAFTLHYKIKMTQAPAFVLVHKWRRDWIPVLLSGHDQQSTSICLSLIIAI